MGKTLMTGFIAFLLILLNALFVAAEIQAVQSEVVLDVDYHQFSDRDQDVLAVPATLTLRNTDTTSVSVTVSVSGLPTGYPSVTSQTVTVPPNNTDLPVNFNVNVPHQRSSGRSTIGTITVTGGDGSPLTIDLVQNTRSMLIIEQLDVDPYTDDDGNEQSDRFDEEDASFELSDPVRPGSEVTLEFRLENLFDSDYDRDGDLDNIELSIKADDDDLYGDFDEDFDLNDIDAHDKDTFTTSFIVEEDADSGSYTITITLEGEDGNSAVHRFVRDLTLEVKRKKDDLRITRALLNPATVSCVRDFTLDLEVRNFGTDDQRDAAVSIYNDKLDINERVANLRIDEFDDSNDRWRQAFSFSAEDAPAGTYVLDLRAYVDGDYLVNTESASLIVQACGAEAEEEDPEATTSQTAQTTTTTTTTGGSTPPAAEQGDSEGTTPVTTSAIVETREASRLNADDLLVAVMVIGLVLILALIGLMIAVLIKK